MNPINIDSIPAKWPIGWNPNLASSSAEKTPTNIFSQFSSYLHHQAARSILPALNISKIDLDQARLAKRKFSEIIQNMQFITADHQQIDGVILWDDKMDKQDSNYTDKNWVLYINGNGDTYEENLSYLSWYAKETGCNVISFNYRGVGQSTGYPSRFKDLVLDADSVFQHLQRHGVASEKILIHARSLGGTVGIKLRALHEDGPICNERSLASWTAVNTSLNGEVIGTAMNLYLKAMDWNIQTLTSWEEIKGFKWIIVSPTDEVIDFKKASFYEGLRHLSEKSDEEFDRDNHVIKFPDFYSSFDGVTPEGHNIPLNSPAVHDVWLQHKEMLKQAFKENS